MPSSAFQTSLSHTGHECFISVGTNIDPEQHYAEVQTILQHECEVLATSTAIRTAPVGYQHQPDFLNAALLIRTPLDYTAFRTYLKAVEERLGRVRGPIKSGPRTMDLDIVVWDGEVIDEGYYQYAYVRGPVDEVLAATGRVLSAQPPSFFAPPSKGK